MGYVVLLFFNFFIFLPHLYCCRITSFDYGFQVACLCILCLYLCACGAVRCVVWITFVLFVIGYDVLASSCEVVCSCVLCIFPCELLVLVIFFFFFYVGFILKQ